MIDSLLDLLYERKELVDTHILIIGDELKEALTQRCSTWLFDEADANSKLLTRNRIAGFRFEVDYRIIGFCLVDKNDYFKGCNFNNSRNTTLQH